MSQYAEILERIEAKQDAVEALLRQTQQDSSSENSVNWRDGGSESESASSRPNWSEIMSRLTKEFSKADEPTDGGGVGDLSCNQTCRDDLKDNTLKRCSMKDLYEQIYCNKDKEQAQSPSPMDDPQVFGRFWSNKLRPGSNSDQWLAAYPPILPRKSLLYSLEGEHESYDDRSE